MRLDQSIVCRHGDGKGLLSFSLTKLPQPLRHTRVGGYAADGDPAKGGSSGWCSFASRFAEEAAHVAKQKGLVESAKGDLGRCIHGRVAVLLCMSRRRAHFIHETQGDEGDFPRSRTGDTFLTSDKVGSQRNHDFG